MMLRVVKVQIPLVLGHLHHCLTDQSSLHLAEKDGKMITYLSKDYAILIHQKSFKIKWS